jgi:hypothetical protein
VEEERKFLAAFAKAAGAVELLNIRVLKVAYAEEIGHSTSESTIYNLLGRHQWRKLMPRPFHPERDEDAQEACKKRFRQAVKKARRVAAARSRALRVMFADEARFGRMNRPRPCWGPAGVRPKVAC